MFLFLFVPFLCVLICFDVFESEVDCLLHFAELFLGNHCGCLCGCQELHRGVAGHAEFL